MTDRTSPRPFTRRSLLTGTAAAAVGATALGSSVTGASAASDVVSVCYVEVNDNDLSLVGDYQLTSTGAPVYDLAIIFAANINYDGTSAYLHLNDRVRATLEDAATQIRPLQDRGIRVLLSVLGNHQGAGFANFPDRAAAAAFAQELTDVVEAYGLDGIDFDDEYANYGANGTGPVNDFSFVHLVQELRSRLGADRLITLYDIGESAERTEYGGVRAGDLLDYAWNPYYGTWQVPTVPGMDASQLSPGAVDLQQTASSLATSYANRTLQEGYGVYLTYNLGDADATGIISSFTRPLYGSAARRV